MEKKSHRNSSVLTTVLFSLALTGCSGYNSAPDQIKAAVYDKISLYSSEIPKGQLSQLIMPTHYSLDLKIDPDEKFFGGNVEIALDVKTETDFIYLHGKFFEVSNVAVILSDGSKISGTYEEVDETGIAKLTFPTKIMRGKAHLVIDYKAPFNESLEGLYKVREKGITYIFSQMEAISARLVFPSFDEPGFKTPYDVTVTAKEDHVVIANSPEKNIENLGNGFKKVTFKTTKPLPTYLLAFAVGEFDVVEWDAIPKTDVRSRTVALRGIATKGKGEGMKFALKNTARVVGALEDYFQIPYPYAKLDILALPDFSYGAMENAGAITYREQLLLLDENSSLNQKRRYFEVHAHELAHQWFGNYVTPKWWNDIWLNESFATWMSQVALDNIMPEYKFREDILRGAQGAMRGDALSSARQIRQPILSNNDITSAFDGITYQKGGGVLAMMDSFLGPDNFRAGIQNYMQRYAFKNADAIEFITAIGEKSKDVPMEDIRASFKSYLEQPGIPYLNIEKSCDKDNTTLKISQSRYFPLGSKGDRDQSWIIPACFGYEVSGVSHKFCTLLKKKVEKVTLPVQGCATYVMPNIDGAGYYRFALDGAGWKSLFAHQDQFSTKTMMSINDSFKAAAYAGTLGITDLLEAAPAIILSDDPAIATAPMGILSTIYSLAGDDKPVIAALNRRLYGAKMKEIGLEAKADDTMEVTKMRRNLVGFMAEFSGDKDLRKSLTKMAYDYVGYKKDGKIHSDLVDKNFINTALKVAVKDSGSDFARHLMAVFQKSTDGTIRGQLLRSVARSTDQDIAKELREKWALTDIIRDNEMSNIIMTHARSKKNRPAFWDWFKDNLDGVKGRIPQFSQAAIPSVGSGFCTVSGRAKVEDFFTPVVKDISGGARSMTQTLEGIDLCIAKKAHFKPMIKEFIKTQK